MATGGQTLLRFAGAVLLGVAATIIDQPSLLVGPPPAVPLVVAARDIPAGSLLDGTGLVIARWPARSRPAGAFDSVSAVPRRITRFPIYKGEPVTSGFLAPQGVGAGLQIGIMPGKRAYGIRIDDMTSLAGLVQPNSRVDVMLVADDPVQHERVAAVFLENVRVLSVGSRREGVQNGQPMRAAYAALEVSPEEAEQLALAGAQGRLQLLLRGYGEPPR